MSFLNKIKTKAGDIASRWMKKQQDREVIDNPVNAEKQRKRIKPKIVQPTCSIAPHKNRRYDGTLRGSIDATKLGVTL